MKTAGQLLQEKRELKELSIAEIAKRIKVKTEYLLALESSSFANLPSTTTTKGFLRNYAHELGLNPDTIIAMFRRDYESKDSSAIIPPGLISPVSHKHRYINANLLLILSSLFVFLVFMVYQLYSWTSLPKLAVIQPQDGEVYGEKVTIRGVTDQNATIQVNDQVVLLDPSGQFTLDILYPAGTNSVVITATSRQGKSRLVERTFQVTK